MTNPKRYNIGAGAWSIDGYLSVDLDPKADINHDLLAMPWPIKTGSAASIYAGHILEHFAKSDGYQVLAEMARILKPGGDLFVAVPDMDIFIDAYVTGYMGEISNYAWQDLNYCAGGTPDREANPAQRHRYLYNRETLFYMSEKTGLKPGRRDFDPGLDNPEYKSISLYIHARKPPARRRKKAAK